MIGEIVFPNEIFEVIIVTLSWWDDFYVVDFKKYGITFLLLQ